MKKVFIAIVLIALCISVSAQNKFGDYFHNKTLRVDVVFGAGRIETQVFLKTVSEQKIYSGPHINLCCQHDKGAYRYCLYDSKTGELIFSKGFCSLLNEWIATPEAKKVNRVFSHALCMPYPKNNVRFVIQQRMYKTGKFHEIFSYDLDPNSYLIGRENKVNYRVDKIHYSGKPRKNLDITFIAEGYKKNEMRKFRNDVKKVAKYMLARDVYKPYADRINIWAVEAVSHDSGTDNPGKGIYRNTVLNSSFYTFNIERYLTTLDHIAIMDAASCAPCDAVIVIVNTSKYGGGGFYNYYALGSADHQLSRQVMVHEFGHSFAGLADEYYNSSVATENFYNLEVEPWEPNITTNVDFKSKWQDMIKSDIPVPTPRIKKYRNVVGMFEGGGYVSKGVYSPVQDCVMKSNNLKEFCPVCKRAIQRSIEKYLED